MTIRKKIEANDRIIQMGDRLKALRNIEKLTVEELAERLEISPRMVYNYENGSNVLSIEIIVRMYEKNIFEGRSLEELLEILVIQIYK